MEVDITSLVQWRERFLQAIKRRLEGYGPDRLLC